MESDDAVKVMDGVQQYNIDWQQGKCLGECLIEMYDQSLWTDVTFLCKYHSEKGAVKAHKMILAARSPVFQAMFYGPCADRNNEIELKHVTKELFDLFIRYMYSDTLDLSSDSANEVLRIANYYQVSSLVQYCAKFLTNIITTDNACDILNNAILYELTELRDICCSFIDHHAMEVLRSETFMNLNKECLLYLLKGDTLHVDEEEILEKVDKWARKKLTENAQEVNGMNVRKCLGDCFYQLRIPTMSSEKLLRSISRKGFFSVEEYADISGYINQIPNVLVSTNSTVRRIPEIQTVMIDSSTIKMNEYISDSVSVTVQIDVEKDVCLSSIALGNVYPFKKGQSTLYSLCENKHYKPVESITKNNIKEYRDKVVQIKEVNLKETCVHSLKPIEELELPTYLNLDISGSVAIECLGFKESFQFRQKHNGNNVIDIIPDILLRKESSPYDLTVELQYGCGSDIKIGKNKQELFEYPRLVMCSGERLQGQIRISYIQGFSGAINSMRFKNFSNRGRDPIHESNEPKSQQQNSDQEE